MAQARQATIQRVGEWSVFFKARLPEEPPEIRARREAAEAAFAELGYPLRKNEDWKYTNVAPIAERVWHPAKSVPALQLPEWEAIRLVIANGILVQWHIPPAYSDSVRIYNWREACTKEPDLLGRYWNQVARWSEHTFAALNTACFQDAALIRILPNQVIHLPFHILVHQEASNSFAQAVFPRVLFHLDSGSRATLVETYSGGSEQCLTCGVVELILEPGAQLDYYKVQQERETSYHIVQAYGQVAKHAELRAHIISLGGGLVRNECDIRLTGEQGVCTLYGLYLARGRQHIDNHTEIEHVAPSCTSYELYRGILTDRGHGVFHGKIYVHPGAQKTDAKQTNQVLLLSDEAEVDSKPQLEIYADDVRCTHGATVGQLDERQLFYLRSRGISDEQARSLLIYAFAEEIVARIEVEAVRYQLEDLLLAEEGLPLESELRRAPLL